MKGFINGSSSVKQHITLTPAVRAEGNILVLLCKGKPQQNNQCTACNRLKINFISFFVLHDQCNLQGNSVLDGQIQYLAASADTGTWVWMLCATLCTFTQQQPWESSAAVIKLPTLWLCKVRCLLRGEKSLYSVVVVCLCECLYFTERFVRKQLTMCFT